MCAALGSPPLRMSVRAPMCGDQGACPRPTPRSAWSAKARTSRPSASPVWSMAPTEPSTVFSDPRRRRPKVSVRSLPRRAVEAHLGVDVVIIEGVGGEGRCGRHCEVHAVEGLAPHPAVVENPGTHGSRLDGEGVPSPGAVDEGEPHPVPDLPYIGAVTQADERPVVETHLRPADPQGRATAGDLSIGVDEGLRQVEDIDVGGKCVRQAACLFVIAELKEGAQMVVELDVGEDQQPMQVVGVGARG